MKELNTILNKLDYSDAVAIGSIFDKVSKLAKLGEKVLEVSPCYFWGYEYNDGDCHFIDCQLDEICKMRDEILKGNTNVYT